MKIAIPTDDGIHIARRMTAAKGFHVFAIELGEIVDEELRWIKAADFVNNGRYALINDCSAILSGPDDRVEQAGRAQVPVIPVGGSNITNIIWHYLGEVARQKADTCCCP